MEEILVCGTLGFIGAYVLFPVILLWAGGRRKIAVLLAHISPLSLATGLWLAHNYYV